MNREFKKFIIRGSIFILPLIVFFGASFYVLYTSGELTNLNSIVAMRQPFIVGMSYTNPLRYIKLKTVLDRHPQIIILGSSRTSRWRSFFFKSPDIFYNAHIGGMAIEDFNIFLDKMLKEYRPKVIFMGMDPDFFDDYICPFNDLPTIKDLEYQYTEEFGKSNGFRAWQLGYTDIYKDYFSEKFILRDLWKHGDSQTRIGLNAAINGDGLRNDGSYLNNRFINSLLANKDRDYKKDLLKDWSSRHVGRTYCRGKREYSLSEVEKFLSESKSKGIYVVGFVPPYSRVALQDIDLADPKNQQLKTLPAVLAPLFKKYSFSFYSFASFSRNYADIEDKEMIDSTHGSEKTDLRIFIHMLANESSLREYADINYLRKILRQSTGNFTILDNK